MSVILDTLQSLTPGQWLAAIVVLLTSYITYNAFLHPLALYPGPISARLGIPGLYQFQQAYRRRYVGIHDLFSASVDVSFRPGSWRSCTTSMELLLELAPTTFQSIRPRLPPRSMPMERLTLSRRPDSIRVSKYSQTSRVSSPRSTQTSMPLSVGLFQQPIA